MLPCVTLCPLITKSPKSVKILRLKGLTKLEESMKITTKSAQNHISKSVSSLDKDRKFLQLVDCCALMYAFSGSKMTIVKDFSRKIIWNTNHLPMASYWLMLLARKYVSRGSGRCFVFSCPNPGTCWNIAPRRHRMQKRLLISYSFSFSFVFLFSIVRLKIYSFFLNVHFSRTRKEQIVDGR